MVGELWTLSRRAKAPRVLVIDDFVPGTQAAARMPRAAELLRAIGAAGAQVTVLPIRGEIIEDPQGLAMLRVRNRDELGRVLSTRTEKFAAIFVSRPHNMTVIADLVTHEPSVTGDALIVYDAETLAAAQEIRLHELGGAPLSPAQAERLMAAEISHARKADVVLAFDEAIAGVFRAAGHPDVRVLGHAAAPRPASPPFRRRNGFLSLAPTYGDDTPMREAIAAFARDVLPALRRTLGRSATLTVAAEAEEFSWRKAADRAVVPMPMPADPAPVFDSARVFVAPWPAANGPPLNILEAAAHGMPVVLTPSLARQLGWTHGREAIVARSTEDLAAACVALHRDQLLWEGLRAGALARVGEECDRGRFDAATRDLVAQAAAPSACRR